MEEEKCTVYFYDGTGGADGANTLFTSLGYVSLHWSGNKFKKHDKPEDINPTGENISVASNKATEYFNKCMEADEDVGGFDWHDSNE